jgi:hypothetical protein
MDDIKFHNQLVCPWARDSIISWIFVHTRLSIFLLQFILYGISLWNHEIHIFFVGLGLSANMLINTALQQYFKQNVPFPGCGENWGLPSFYAQQVMFFYVMFITYPAFWKTRTSSMRAALISIWCIFTIYGQLYLNYNHPTQIIVGALIGIVFGITYQGILFFYIAPNYESMRKNYFFRHFIADKNNMAIEAA